MIPHERTPLTHAERQALLELERSLERVPAEAPHPRTWPCQLAGVVIVAISTLMVGGLASSARADTTVIVEAMIGVVGLMVGAALAIDPVRRRVRSISPAISPGSWRRRRLVRKIDRSGRRSRLRRRSSAG